MKKIALLLALLMIVGCFAACGGDSEKNDATDPVAATGGAAGQQNNNDANSGEVDLEACPASDDSKHHYTEEVAGEPACVLPGLMMYTCNDCGYSTSREIPALGHQGTGANCEEPSICSVCGEVAEEAWGHESDGGVCKNCGIDLVVADATDATVNATEATTEATTAAE